MSTLHCPERGCAQPISPVHVSHVTSSGVRTLGTFVVDLRSPVESSALAWPYAERTSARAHALPRAAAPQRPSAHTQATALPLVLRSVMQIKGSRSMVPRRSSRHPRPPRRAHLPAIAALHRACSEAELRWPHVHGRRLFLLRPSHRSCLHLPLDLLNPPRHCKAARSRRSRPVVVAAVSRRAPHR
jgi:hypothetical protein